MGAERLEAVAEAAGRRAVVEQEGGAALRPEAGAERRGEPSGQRWVTVLTLVQNLTPSVPYWLVSPKALRFQPPNV